MILLAAAAGDAYRSNYFLAFLERDAAGEDHYFPAVGGVNAEELVARLAVLAEGLCGDVEGT